MLSNKLTFCVLVSLAILVVVLLATLSPVPHRKSSSKPWLALSLYIQQPKAAILPNTQTVAPQDAGALIFHRVLTEGPKNTSRVIGKAQGFIIPVNQFSGSGFNIIYLTFDTHEYSGSVGIQATNLGSGQKDELTVVGGTGSFAFVRGIAVLTQKDGHDSNLVVPHHIKLHLKYPNRSKTIPG